MVSPVDMEGWEVRPYRRTAIHYRGARYFIRHKENRDGKLHYILEPWPEDSSDMAGLVVEYGRGYVVARDRELEARARARKLRLSLAPIQPLLGFLPASVKRRLADAYGIAEDRVTFQSVVLEGLLILPAIAVLVIEFLAPIVGRGFGVEVTGMVFLRRAATFVLILGVPDAVMRYTKILGESSRCYGFWEWLFHRD